MANLSQRRLQPELMDQPDLEPERHRHALRGLARLNFFSRSAEILWPSLRRLADERARPLRVLDVASGGGDVVLGLWRKARRANVKLEILGLDMSPVAIEHARQRAAAQSADVRFEQRDVLMEDLPGRYDVTMSSLFLHHLEDPTVVQVLGAMARATEQLLLINDLRRCHTGYLAAHLACRALTTSDVVHVDGPRSVEGAFTPAELSELFAQAGLRGATIGRRWPFRMLAQWKPV